MKELRNDLKDDNTEVKFNLGDLSIFPEETRLKNEPEYNLTKDELDSIIQHLFEV